MVNEVIGWGKAVCVGLGFLIGGSTGKQRYAEDGMFLDLSYSIWWMTIVFPSFCGFDNYGDAFLFPGGTDPVHYSKSINSLESLLDAKVSFIFYWFKESMGFFIQHFISPESSYTFHKTVCVWIGLYCRRHGRAGKSCGFSSFESLWLWSW